MSFISVIIGDDFISIVADSRETECLNSGERRVVYEFAEKITKVSDYSFFAMVGECSAGFDFIDVSHLKNMAYNRNGKIVSSHEMMLWHEVTRKSLRGKFNLIIGGVDIFNRIVCYILNSTNTELSEIIADDGKAQSIIFPSTSVDKDLPMEMLNSLLDIRKNETIESYVAIQYALNDYVAEIDCSVNKNITSFVIRK
ncbi:hypothetical protein [Paenibacillus sp. FSL P4-0502]|uniref:hypothetical protein n=1 Tax=Paenibacillus sp. FSL P4-0502 TaxID=2975319 RepID=UPI0030F8E772